MKTKYLLLIILASVMAGCTCDNEPSADVASSGIPDGCVPVRLNFSASGVQTRTSVSGQFTHWQQGDRIGVFSPEAYYEWENSYIAGKLFYNTPAANICLDVESGFGTPSASFVASDIYADEVIRYTGGWGWNTKYDVHNFYAYYPYADASKANTPFRAVPFALPSVQRQSCAGSSEHIGPLDFLYASAAVTVPQQAGDKSACEGDVVFDFHHAFAVLQMTVRNSMTESVTVDAVEVASDDAPLAGRCTVDLSSGAVSPGKSIDATGKVVDVPRGFSSRVSLEQSASLARNETAVLSMVVFPGDFTRTGLTVTVHTSAGIMTVTSKKVLEAGVAYAKTLTLSASAVKPAPTYELAVADFEDADDEVLAADAGGSNFYTGFAIYEDAATGLIFGNNDGPFSQSGSSFMYDGGLYVSRFNDMLENSYSNQCSVYYKDAVTGCGGHRGSRTFCLGYGYDDVIPTEYGRDNRPAMVFGDAGREAVIDHMWVTNSTYAALTMLEGGFVATPFSYERKSYMLLTATGFRADGTQTGKAEIYLADFRTQAAAGIVREWIKFDLSALGAVNKVVFNVESSDVGEYGMNTPGYFCMDDVAVRVEKTE